MIALREDCFENWLESWLSLKEAVLDIRVNIDSLSKGRIQGGIMKKGIEWLQNMRTLIGI